MNVPTEVILVPVYLVDELTRRLTGGLLSVSATADLLFCVNSQYPLGLGVKFSHSPVATEHSSTLDLGSRGV